MKDRHSNAYMRAEVQSQNFLTTSSTLSLQSYLKIHTLVDSCYKFSITFTHTVSKNNHKIVTHKHITLYIVNYRISGTVWLTQGSTLWLSIEESSNLFFYIPSSWKNIISASKKKYNPFNFYYVMRLRKHFLLLHLQFLQNMTFICEKNIVLRQQKITFSNQAI